MLDFIQKHAAAVMGVLSGLDRIVFRCTLRNLSFVAGFMKYLNCNRVLLKDAGAHFEEVSEMIKKGSLREARRLDRPVIYLQKSSISKEDMAREIAMRDGVTEGLICVLTIVEVCQSFEICKNREAKKLEAQPRTRKCLHYYHYWMDPEMGLMHARLQTWFPFTIQVCINGRSWLARSMDRAGLKHEKKENCFTWLEDVVKAQQLADEQLKTNWQAWLEKVALRVNPLLAEALGKYESKYYGSVRESEYATDVMFKSDKALAAIYPDLVRHGMTTFKSPDVMRFLGKPTTVSGKVNGCFKDDVTSDLKVRSEGVRIKHRAGQNSVKMYDKQGSVLRVETTINDPRMFKSHHAPEGRPDAPPKWLRMRQGVADTARRAEVSLACNMRYLDAQAKVVHEQSLETCLDGLSRAAKLDGRRVRGLNLFGDDGKLLGTLGAGELAINGFRNRDIQQSLYGDAAPKDKAEARRRSSRVTRQLRMLRAHKLIKKVPKTHRYQLTAKGLTAVVSLGAAKNSSVKKLGELVA